jgi:hypothetical protein
MFNRLIKIFLLSCFFISFNSFSSSTNIQKTATKKNIFSNLHLLQLQTKIAATLKETEQLFKDFQQLIDEKLIASDTENIDELYNTRSELSQKIFNIFQTQKEIQQLLNQSKEEEQQPLIEKLKTLKQQESIQDFLK